MEANFMQIVDYVEEKFLDEIDGERIYAVVGRDTKKLFGFKVYAESGKTRNISFGEIDTLKRIIEKM
jgi:hypothetical protein